MRVWDLVMGGGERMRVRAVEAGAALRFEAWRRGAADPEPAGRAELVPLSRAPGYADLLIRLDPRLAPGGLGYRLAEVVLLQAAAAGHRRLLYRHRPEDPAGPALARRLGAGAVWYEGGHLVHEIAVEGGGRKPRSGTWSFKAAGLTPGGGSRRTG